MKTILKSSCIVLLCILLFPTCSIAQFEKTPKQYKIFAESQTQITIQLLFQYEKECFNDSTVSYYFRLCDDADCWNLPCEKGSFDEFGNQCPEHWKHKEPTFADFLLWLRKRSELQSIR